MIKKALILFSGGLDSTACILWARRSGLEAHALIFNYGQNNSREIQYAKIIADKLGVPYEEADVSGLFKQISNSAMIGNTEKIGGYSADGLPNTFLPGRNLIFFSLATAYAVKKDIGIIIIGNSQTGTDRYPDNTDLFLKSINVACNIAVEKDLQFISPLQFLTKEEIISSYKYFEDLISLTYTCYAGTNPSCGICPACVRRQESFKNLGLTDTIKYK